MSNQLDGDIGHEEIYLLNLLEDDRLTPSDLSCAMNRIRYRRMSSATKADVAGLVERLRSEVAFWENAYNRRTGQAIEARSRAATAEASLAEVKAEVERNGNVLEEARRAIGDHWAPNDCYATGPLTGDPIRDLVECPACSFIAMYDKMKARAALGSGKKV